MPKPDQKAAGAARPAGERGKSRFAQSGRPARVVLPERPPRAVDNEIVSILLGADPASLTEQGGGSTEGTATLAQVPAAVEPAHANVSPVAVPAQEFATQLIARPEADSAKTLIAETAVDSSADSVSNVLAPSPAREESRTAPLRVARPRRAAPPAAVKAVEKATGPAAQDGSISSFEEFAERWKHGLRKGQLKICEVLYQKTYAVGRTDCVTSFSELGRLSGLKMRQCFNIIAQLEALKFVERSRATDTSNKKDQGSFIRFHLFPVQ